MEIENLESKVYCRKCKVHTNHGILEKYKEVSEGRPFDYDWTIDYYIVRCLGCDTIAYATKHWDEMMIAPNSYNEMGFFTEVTVYPEEPKKEKQSKFELRPEKNFDETPALIQMMYSQVISAFNMESYLLSAVGLRMIIEGICNDLKIKSGYILDDYEQYEFDKNNNKVMRSNLEGRINGLVETRIIVQAQANILHQIRTLGNASAHELQVPERSTIKLALEIIESIVHQIYQLHKYQIK